MLRSIQSHLHLWIRQLPDFKQDVSSRFARLVPMMTICLRSFCILLSELIMPQLSNKSKPCQMQIAALQVQSSTRRIPKSSDAIFYGCIGSPTPAFWLRRNELWGTTAQRPAEGFKWLQQACWLPRAPREGAEHSCCCNFQPHQPPILASSGTGLSSDPRYM